MTSWVGGSEPSSTMYTDNRYCVIGFSLFTTRHSPSLVALYTNARPSDRHILTKCRTNIFADGYKARITSAICECTLRRDQAADRPHVRSRFVRVGGGS